MRHACYTASATRRRSEKFTQQQTFDRTGSWLTILRFQSECKDLTPTERKFTDQFITKPRIIFLLRSETNPQTRKKTRCSVDVRLRKNRIFSKPHKRRSVSAFLNADAVKRRAGNSNYSLELSNQQGNELQDGAFWTELRSVSPIVSLLQKYSSD